MSARGRGLLSLAICAGAAALALPGSARAHAALVRSDPADGARLGASPHRISLWFDEEVTAGLSDAELSGARIGPVSHISVGGRGDRLLVSLPKLRPDTYSLRWLAVSADDLHITPGMVVFGVGAAFALPQERPKAAVPPGAPGPDTSEVALRWLDFAAIAGLIGALALIAVCIPRAARRGATGLDDARERLAGVAVASAALALVTGAGLLLVQAHGFSALGTVVAHTTYGKTWIARELIVAVLLVLVMTLRRRQAGAALTATAVGASLALCASIALSSHSASARGSVSVATSTPAL